MDLEGRNALVVGLGVSGLAAARLLASKGARVSVTEFSDSEEVREKASGLEDLGIKCETGGHTRSFCSGAELVVTSPGVDTRKGPVSSVLPAGSPVISELELGSRFCRAPIIAITGTNGKSTTTELTGRILSLSGRHAVVCGNIGNPLSAEVEKMTPESVAVVEVSSFQLETTAGFRPYIAALLNISEDHYDRHGTIEEYKAQKFRVFSGQTADDWAVIHADLYGEPMTKDIKSQLIFFGAEKDPWCHLDGEDCGDLVNMDETPLRGKHNMNNMICSMLVSRIMGVEDRYIREGIITFKALDHRFERVGDLRGIEFIDDSKATNIDATRWALESMNKKTVLIAGGRDKGGDYLSVLSLAKEKIKAMVLIGEARERIKEAFAGSFPVLTAESMGEAVRRAYGIAREGEAVLLSPMCSSFDMFTGYKQRGEAFQREVRSLIEK